MDHQHLNNSTPGNLKSPSVYIPKEMGMGAWNFQSRSSMYQTSTDASLFSSSLPVLPHEKLSINDPGKTEKSRLLIDDVASNLNKLHQDGEGDDSLNEVISQTIGFLLPDDEEDLLSGILDYDYTPPADQNGDAEEFDLFGGMEMEGDSQETLSSGMSKMNLTDSVIGNGMVHYGPANAIGTIAGEHPYGEHPSRTLFVRNINSNVEDSELRSLFEQHGDIRTLYTACKHRGFVMIAYYDIRDARSAMRALQNKPLRRRKLDIHFSIPKDNPSDKDINQGTLVVFNLDPSVSNEDLRVIFGAYGEVKEIRETPHKRHHKFIEFYDVRAAEAALRALNRSDIAGKRIKLEPSRPGGTRRNLMLQLNQELDPDEARTLRHHIGSPVTNSPPGNWTQFNSPVEHSPTHTFSRSPGSRMSPSTNNSLPGLASILQGPSSLKVAPIGKDPGRGSFASSIPEQGSNFQHPHSFPELKLGPYSGNVSSFGASSSNASGIETLSGPQFLWGSPGPFSDSPKTNARQAPSGSRPLASNGHAHVFPYSSQRGSYAASFQHQHHVGSAPSGISLQRQFGFFPDSPETSFMNHSAFGSMNLGSSNANYMMNVGHRTAVHGGIAGNMSGITGNMSETGSPSFRLMSSPRLSPMFLGNGPYPGLAPNTIDNDRIRSQRMETSANQMDSKKQFQLDLEKIAKGEDSRTTLMIKNIPNKYTSKMLLAAIDESHKGAYDFLYLPIDFKNKCNVGYAFINMLSPSHIIPFYEAFDGKKWEKFNSEKVASLAYARIQGRSALIAHFQNSSLMNEDKRCRPILFHSEGIEAGEQIIQEHLPSCSMNIQEGQPNGSEPIESTGNAKKADSEEKDDDQL